VDAIAAGRSRSSSRNITASATIEALKNELMHRNVVEVNRNPPWAVARRADGVERAPAVEESIGAVRRCKRLGGLLNYYCRSA